MQLVRKVFGALHTSRRFVALSLFDYVVCFALKCRAAVGGKTRQQVRESVWRYLGTALSSTRRLPVFCMLHMPCLMLLLLLLLLLLFTLHMHSSLQRQLQKVVWQPQIFQYFECVQQQRQQATSNNNNFKLRTWRFFLKIFMLAQRLLSPLPLPLPQPLPLPVCSACPG